MNRLLRRRVAFGALIALALLAALAAVPLVNAHFTSHAAGSGRWTIHGHLVPAVRGHHVLAQSPDTAQALDLSISLSLRNQSGLTQLIAAQNNPHSGLYHQYLSSREFQGRFSPTQATVNQVTAWLRSQGLVVHSVAANHLLIDASGSAATVEAAFQTTLASYQVNGRTVYAPTVEPSVPDALTGLIVNIAGLDDVGIYTHAPIIQNHSRATRPHDGSGPGGGYTPSELRTAYDMNSLISSADGTGQTVAIFELDGYVPGDVNAYLSNYGLGAPKYSDVLVDGAANTAGPGAIEAELDMETVSAIAPGAAQKIYIGPNDHIGVQWTYNQIVVDNTAKVVSTSWGLCEAHSNTSDLQALDNIFQQGAAQGQAFFAASGDAGAYDCGDYSLGVDSPADDPNVVGAGGTTLQTGSGGSYTSESVWSDPSDPTFGPEGVGSGGGLSAYFAKPTYQTGPGTTNSYSNGMRQVPDVSADADPNTGYSMYCTVSLSGCSSSTPWIEVGGTSAAAPLWAGIATDLNQYLIANSKPGLGTANMALYSLSNTSQTYPAFHDVTSGDNLYYPATSGYDQASGIGTPDVWNMARDLLAANRISDFSMNVPTSTSVPEGYISNLTITTVVISGSASAINLSANGSYAGLTGSFNPASVAPGRTTTLTVSADYSVPPGNYTLAVTGVEGSVSHTYAVAVTVTSDFNISASPGNITVVQGTSGTVTISAVGTGSIHLEADLYRPPSNAPVFTFSPVVITSSTPSTLIISANSLTPLGTYGVTVIGISSIPFIAHPTYINLTVVAPGNSGGMTNGGFETGTLSNWTSIGTAAISSSAHTGGDAAQLGSTSPSRSDSSISQTFTVAAGYGSLSFWYKVVCPDTVNFDWTTAVLRDNTASSTITMLPHICANNGAWVQVSAPVTAGHSYTLTLSSHDDNYPGDGTYTLFDDVTLAATAPNPFINGGFEDGGGGLNGWTTMGWAHGTPVSHSGSWGATAGFDGGRYGDSTISQTVTVPAGDTTLSFWYMVVCPDTVTYDWATAILQDNTANTTTTVLPHTCTNNDTWVPVTASVIPGHTYTLTLTDHDDGWVGDPTYTYFDDVSIS